MTKSSSGLFDLWGRPAMLLGLALLTVVSLSVSTAQAVDDEEDPKDLDFSSASYIEYYGLYPGGAAWEVSYKALYVTTSLTDHCITDAETKLPHIHVEYDFSYSSRTDWVDRFWDWYYDECSGISRISSATNTTNGFCYAMDGYAGSANYDYSVEPPYANFMFNDDCASRSYYPSLSAQADDRIVYAFEVDEVLIAWHATIATAVESNKPTDLRWKMGYSGVYEWDVSGDSDAERFSTPGALITDWVPCEPPSKTYYRQWWPDTWAYVFYAN